MIKLNKYNITYQLSYFLLPRKFLAKLIFKSSFSATFNKECCHFDGRVFSILQQSISNTCCYLLLTLKK